MKREMPSGGHHSPTAFIFLVNSHSKKSPLDPPSPWSWLGTYFVRKFFQFAVFLNRQTAVPIFGQLRLPIISSFASHAVLLSFGVAQEHSTLVVSNLDGAHWAHTFHQTTFYDFNQSCRSCPNFCAHLILTDQSFSDVIFESLQTRIPVNSVCSIRHDFYG